MTVTPGSVRSMPDLAGDDRPWHRLSVLDRLGVAWRRLVGRQAASTAARSYGFLARQLAVDLPRTGQGAVLLLSAAVPSASSNEAVLLLANALRAELSSRVLLLDGTFGDQGVGAHLGFSQVPGVLDLVRGENGTLAKLVQPTQHPGVAVLPAGLIPVGSTATVRPAAVVELYREASGQFDHILVQQRAIFEDARYLPFASWADLVLLLVEEGVTLVEEVDRALKVFRDHQIGQVRLMLCEPG